MARRTAAGILLSNDGMWWWDGSRWHPATAATRGRPPRAPTSPWPWVLAALVALALITALPVWLIWGRTGGGASAVTAFDRGYANTYLSQRRAALTSLQHRFDDLNRCETATSGACLRQVDALAQAASGEAGTIETELGLFFFPGCLKPSARAESSALVDAQNGSERLRLLTRAQQAAQLNAIGADLRRAGAAVATSPCT